MKDIEYEERAQLLNLDSLSCKMDKVYKILHGFLEGVQWRDFFQKADISRLRGRLLKQRKDRSRLQFTFSQRVVNMWNDLQPDVVTDASAKAFKNKLEAHLKNLPGLSPE